MNVMGSYPFMLTRNALFRDRLHLGEWHGSNEVSLNNLVQPAAIEYRFRLSRGAYAYFIFNRSQSGHDGVRLSRDQRFPGIFYQADRTNKFTSRTPLYSNAVVSDGWHSLTLSFVPGKVSANLDGSEIGSMPVAIKEQQIIGVRGGLQPADIESVRITGIDGRPVFYESFTNRRHYWTILPGVGISSLLLISLAAIPVFRARSDKEAKFAVFRCLMGLGVAIIVLSLLFGFDYYFWSSRYLYLGYLPEDAHPHYLAMSAESLRKRLFMVPTDLRGVSEFPVKQEVRESISRWPGGTQMAFTPVVKFDHLHTDVPEFLSDEQLRATLPKDNRTLRIAFIGTSQTYGSGAEVVSDTFVARCHHFLSAIFSGVSVETYNFSISGSASAELLAKYRETWKFTRPDLVVINLSNNERNVDAFNSNLHALADEIRGAGGQAVFLLEANAAEADHHYLEMKHSTVRKLGQELNVPVWDLNGYLSSAGVYDSGMLWWDHVHLASYGHALVAEWLVPQLVPRLSHHRLSGPQSS
jgi:lysophospholipase L1-like esterase